MITGRAFRWFAIAFIVAVIAALLLTVMSAGGLGTTLIVAALLAYVLHPVASWLESVGLNRTSAVVAVFLALVALIIAVASLLYPILEAQLDALQAGEYETQTSALINRTETFVRHRFGFLGLDKLNLREEVERVRGEIGKAFSKFLVAGLVPSVAHLVAIPFVSFFLLKDARTMKKTLIGMVPNRYFEFSLDVLYKMDLAMGNFLRGQFLDGLIFGVLVTVAMWILNVKYSIVIGIFAGMANLIPYVGPFAGASLAVMIVLLTTGDLTRVAIVLLAFVIAKLLDDIIIQPVTVGRSVNMHPMLVLLVIIVGGQFFGVLGMLLAVPVTGFIKVALQAGISLFKKYRFTLLSEAEPSRS
jgi:predicted PurR-regulated permease PerM